MISQEHVASYACEDDRLAAMNKSEKHHHEMCVRVCGGGGGGEGGGRRGGGGWEGVDISQGQVSLTSSLFSNRRRSRGSSEPSRRYS